MIEDPLASFGWSKFAVDEFRGEDGGGPAEFPIGRFGRISTQGFARYARSGCSESLDTSSDPREMARLPPRFVIELLSETDASNNVFSSVGEIDDAGNSRINISDAMGKLPDKRARFDVGSLCDDRVGGRYEPLAALLLYMFVRRSVHV